MRSTFFSDKSVLSLFALDRLFHASFGEIFGKAEFDQESLEQRDFNVSLIHAITIFSKETLKLTLVDFDWQNLTGKKT